MPERRQNQQQVLAFLQDYFATSDWEFSIPQGSGKEKYLARAATRHGESACFVKLDVNIPVYQTVASLELTPPILASGCLQDGTPLIVQPAVKGRQPTWQDFSIHLDLFASTLQRLHHSPELRSLLAAPASETYRAAGLQFLNNIHLRWEAVKSHFSPEIDSIVLDHLERIAAQLRAAPGGGLVNTHTDPCNANWLLPGAGRAHHFIVDGGVVRFQGDLHVVQPGFHQPLHEARVGQAPGVGITRPSCAHALCT